MRNKQPTGADRLAFARASAVALVVATVTACAHDEPASDLEAPDLVWEDSEPSGEFEDSAWLQAVREAELLASVAWNNLDYSDPDLINAWGYDTVADTLFPTAEERLDEARTEIEVSPNDATIVDQGPVPLLPLAVEVGANDSATVVACVAGGFERLSGAIASWAVVSYEVQLTSNGGSTITVNETAAAVKESFGDTCGPGASLPQPRFDPPPEPPTDPEVKIKPPVHPDAYGQSFHEGG